MAYIHRDICTLGHTDTGTYRHYDIQTPEHTSYAYTEHTNERQELILVDFVLSLLEETFATEPPADDPAYEAHDH